MHRHCPDTPAHGLPPHPVPEAALSLRLRPGPGPAPPRRPCPPPAPGAALSARCWLSCAAVRSAEFALCPRSRQDGPQVGGLRPLRPFSLRISISPQSSAGGEGGKGLGGDKGFFCRGSACWKAFQPRGGQTARSLVSFLGREVHVENAVSKP